MHVFLEVWQSLENNLTKQKTHVNGYFWSWLQIIPIMCHMEAMCQHSLIFGKTLFEAIYMITLGETWSDYNLPLTLKNLNIFGINPEKAGLFEGIFLLEGGNLNPFLFQEELI